MNVLVTGATGTLGQATVARLLADGHNVAIVTRRPFLADRLFGTRIGIHEWHPLSERLPPAAIEGRETILHLMGAPICGGPSRDRLALAEASRVTATRRIAEALGKRRVRLVVASLAFAPTSSGGSVTENVADCAPATPGERAIMAWEAEARLAATTGASVAIVRLGLIAAANGGPLHELIRLARRGIYPNLDGALIPAISLEDATAILIALLRQPHVEGLVHGVAPIPLAGEALSDALTKLSPIGKLPGLPVSLLGARLGLASLLLDCRQHLLSGVLQEIGFELSAPNPTASFMRALAGPSSASELLRAGEEAAPTGSSPSARAPQA